MNASRESGCRCLVPLTPSRLPHQRILRGSSATFTLAQLIFVFLTVRVAWCMGTEEWKREKKVTFATCFPFPSGLVSRGSSLSFESRRDQDIASFLLL